MNSRVNCCAVLSSSVMSLFDPMDCSLPGSSVCGDSLGKNPGVGCNFLLQRIFPTLLVVKDSLLLEPPEKPSKVDSVQFSSVAQ